MFDINKIAHAVVCEADKSAKRLGAEDPCGDDELLVAYLREFYNYMHFERPEAPLPCIDFVYELNERNEVVFVERPPGLSEPVTLYLMQAGGGTMATDYASVTQYGPFAPSELQ